MTDREKEILNAINEMGLFRTPYPNDEVSRLVSKLIKDKVAELEKIKSEIENMWIKSAKDLRTGGVIYENLCEHSEVLEIIDKHISELKGENNDL